MAVKFFNADRSVKLANRRKLRLFITDLFARSGKSFRSLSYIFCSDEYLLAINRQYLYHDDYTDIISFLLSDPGEAIEGEIYISVERVRENAAALKVSFNEELHRVIFHGALHLLGFKDKSSADKLEMTAAENDCLERYFNSHK